ncbi:MAG: LppU/SCO3897 family protein [Mycobacteriaceae bacterium]
MNPDPTNRNYPQPYGSPFGYPAMPSGDMQGSFLTQKKSKTLLISGIAGTAAFLVVGFAAFLGFLIGKDSREVEHQVGDCLSIKFSDNSHEDDVLYKHDCSDPAALYEVASIGQGDISCDEDSYLPFLIFKDSTRQETKKTLCLAMNLNEGMCFNGNNDTEIETIDCQYSDAVKVIKRLDGKNDPALCTEEQIPLATDVPLRTYCFALAPA